MRVAVAFDHRGVRLRDAVLSELDARGHRPSCPRASTAASGTPRDFARSKNSRKERPMSNANNEGARGGTMGSPTSSRLHKLSELGQSVWIDFLSREMLQTGGLERLMRDDAVVGVTSNP